MYGPEVRVAGGGGSAKGEVAVGRRARGRGRVPRRWRKRYTDTVMVAVATEKNQPVNTEAAAKNIPTSARASILEGLAETELHQRLKMLLERMVPGAYVEVTHGSTEYGKDIVLIKEDPLVERVAAFVVKRGKIAGRTAGVVDEIISQIDQAYAHPAETKISAEPKKVKEVFVVVSGSISGNARKRIIAEVKGPIQDIWDLERLVREFTEHYPAVFFETETVDFIERRVTELEAHPIFMRAGQDSNLTD